MSDWYTDGLQGGASNEGFGAPSAEATERIKAMEQVWKKFNSTIKDTHARIEMHNKLKKMYNEIENKGITSTGEMLKLHKELANHIIKNNKGFRAMTQQLSVLSKMSATVATDSLKKTSAAVTSEAKSIAGSAGKVASTLASTAKSFMSSGGSITSLSSFFLETLPQNAGKALGQVGELSGKIFAIIGKVGPVIVKFVTGMLSGILKFIPRIGTALSELVDIVGKILGRLTKVISSALQGVAKVVEVAAPIIGEAIGFIGSIIQKSIEVALAEGQLSLAAFEKFSDMVKSGGGTEGKYKVFGEKRGAGWDALWGEVGRGVGPVTDNTMMDVAATFFKGAEGAITKAVESGQYNKVWQVLSKETYSLSQTYFSGLNMAGFIRDVSRKNQVAGEDLIDTMTRTTASMTGKSSPLYNLGLTAKNAGLEVKSLMGPMVEVRDIMAEMNMTWEQSANLITKIVQMGDTLKQVGIDAGKSAGKIAKELSGVFKKWDKGLKAFVSYQAFGKQAGGNIFSAMNMAEFGGGGLNKMFSSVFDIMEGLTKNMDADTALFTKRHFLETTMGLSEETALAMAKGGRDLLNDPEKLKAIYEEQKRMANPTVTIMNNSQRQIEIQGAMVQIQKAMLMIMRATATLTFNFLAQIVRIIFDIARSLAVGFTRLIEVVKLIHPKNWGNVAALFGDNKKEKELKEKMKEYDQKAENQLQASNQAEIKNIKTNFETITKLGKKAFILSDADTKLVKETSKEMLHGAEKTQKMIKLKTESISAATKLAQFKVDQADFNAASVSITNMGKIVEPDKKSKKGSFDSYAPDKHHFGGKFEKFHYGGIIKQGTEALLMSPNPTAVLSPNDTRQAVRGSKEKHVHVHFNAPVYGIQKFEEMVNRMVMKAATGVR